MWAGWLSVICRAKPSGADVCLPALTWASSINFASNHHRTAIERLTHRHRTTNPGHRTTDAPPSNYESGPSYEPSPPSPVKRALGPPSYEGSYRYRPTGPHQIEHDASSTAQIDTPQLLCTGFQTLNKIDNAGSSRALFVSQANRSLRATRTINEIDAFVRRLASFDRLFALKLV
ncbi:hypothetical protein PCASD_02963 [Puccinia coronata f. sp. avenae]|uniref:Uncharacterized protein n=1 Tax=Puccinia coronata f. sp. avenae TaxID=200324 RepID=A0A2N5VGP1_9BASI|nr:hypothetical protein PCASD_02963 [Puccinia coronata f. sp. avenae]